MFYNVLPLVFILFSGLNKHIMVAVYIYL